MSPSDRVPRLLADLFRVVGELEATFPGRRFTPDGHLVGSLGECLAAYHYGLTLLRASSPGSDAVKDGRSVEIKATFAQRVSFRPHVPDHLLVLRLDRCGGFEEIYNGPASPVWKCFDGKRMPSNGQHQLSLVRLRAMAQDVEPEDRLAMVVPNEVIAGTD